MAECTVCGGPLVLLGLLGNRVHRRCRSCGLDQSCEAAWVTFTRRTEDPKLGWLERQLDDAGIAHRRNGESFHAPILEVPEEQLDAAWQILDPVDYLPDDDPRWEQD